MNLPIGFAQAKIIDDPVNGVSYQIVDANEIFGEYFKLDVSDYTGKNLKESKIEVLQDINAWFTAYNNSGTKEGDLMDVEITMESLQKVFNTVMYKSEADYINMVVIDITDQKDTENKLSKAIVDANAAYKTQAEFLANMSHEIRTPINGILGMLQLTLMADDLQADYRDNLVTAKNCADTLLRLINDILDSVSWKQESTRSKKKHLISNRRSRRRLLLRYHLQIIRGYSSTVHLETIFQSW